MAVELLYFAWVREAIGVGAETVEPPDEVRTVGELVSWLTKRGGGYAEALAEPEKLRAAVDQQFMPMDAAIGGAKEIALFPPVTGG